MKKLSIWFISILTIVLGFTSCDDVEEFETCPEVNINVENETGSAVYRFAAQLESIEDVRFTWSIDGEDVDTGNLNDLASQIFDYRFEPGTYTVCVKVASDECPIQVCTEIEVERDENDPCPDLFFESRQYERPMQYKFIADFKGIEEVSYGWFINGELVEDSAPDEDNYLIWNFDEPGRYEVCIKTETPDCPEGASYCKVIEVEEENNACPEVSFTKEMEPGTVGTYVFESIIEGTDEVSEIQWFVNDRLIENATDQEEGNRVLVYEFEPGEYKVCLKVFTADCPEGVIYCKEIAIGEGGCPETIFDVQPQDHEGVYKFIAEVQREDALYYWYINGQLAGDAGQYYFIYDFLLDQTGNVPGGPGEYEICLQIETSNCPREQSEKFCKTVVVEGSSVCPELFFEAEQDGDNPAYYFYPREFEGMANVTLEWSINGELVDSVSGAGDPFYYQFNPGTYEICLMIETPDCPEGIKYCKTLTVQ